MMASGIALGAYGAHGLQAVVTEPRLLQSYEYAVLYQLVTGLGFFAIAWGTSHFRPLLVNLAGFCLLLGSLSFSLSLYFIVLLGLKVFPYITPIGGAFMIFGWILFAVASLTSKPQRSYY